MTDYFDTEARLSDLTVALGHTLLDPNLTLETKREELARVFDRMNRLEAQRPLAENLSVLADLAGGDAA